MKRKTKEDFIRFSETGYMQSIDSPCVTCPARKLYNACGRKKKFGSHKEALKFKNDLHLDGTLHPYKCEFCKGYHLGHPVPKKKSKYKKEKS